MKNHMNKVWLTSLLLTGTYVANAQQLPQPPAPAPGQPQMLAGGPQQPPRPPKPGKRPGDDRRPGEDRGPKDEAIKLTSVKGTVLNPVANDRFEYNSLLVKTSTGNIAVMFPPHLGEEILGKAKNGSAITVTGFDRTDPEGKKEFRLVSLDVNGSTVTDTPPVAPPVPGTQEQKSITATVKELNYSPRKEVNGFTLSSGERVGIPPHIAQQLTAQLKPGEKITVNGFAEPKRQGVVYSQSVKMIRAQTLTINGQAYLVR